MKINKVKKQQIPIRLSAKAIALLDAMAQEQGLSKSGVLEIVIRKAAEDAENSMPLVYDILHPVPSHLPDPA